MRAVVIIIIFCVAPRPMGSAPTTSLIYEPLFFCVAAVAAPWRVQHIHAALNINKIKS